MCEAFGWIQPSRNAFYTVKCEATIQLTAFNKAIAQVRRSLIPHPVSLAMRLECFTFERFQYVGLALYERAVMFSVIIADRGKE